MCNIVCFLSDAKTNKDYVRNFPYSNVIDDNINSNVVIDWEVLKIAREINRKGETLKWAAIVAA
jgi:hypothetical protein